LGSNTNVKTLQVTYCYGDILLLDSGADYANYASDMTRTLPVNGKFTARQKEVYNAVLRVMQAAKQLLKPGTLLMEYHVQVGQLMEKRTS